MLVKVRNKEMELKYTFNSFRFMEDFDLSALEDLEVRPFKILPVVTMLLLGALNQEPKKIYTLKDVNDFLEEYVVEGSLPELLEELMKLLQESNFFKALQKSNKVEEK